MSRRERGQTKPQHDHIRRFNPPPPPTGQKPSNFSNSLDSFPRSTIEWNHTLTWGRRRRWRNSGMIGDGLGVPGLRKGKKKPSLRSSSAPPGPSPEDHSVQAPAPSSFCLQATNQRDRRFSLLILLISTGHVGQTGCFKPYSVNGVD